MQTTNETGTFINGRAQVVEMLKIMPHNERELLLKNMRMRNPNLVNELVEESLSFNQLTHLEEHEIQLVLQYVQPPILGVALKNTSQAVQRHILSIVPRNYAEEAFKTMMTPIANEHRDSERAQSKITGVMISLGKKRRINL